MRASLACWPCRTSRRSANCCSVLSRRLLARPAGPGSASARAWLGQAGRGLVALDDPAGHLHLELAAQQRDLADLLQVGVDGVLGVPPEVVRTSRGRPLRLGLAGLGPLGRRPLGAGASGLATATGCAWRRASSGAAPFDRRLVRLVQQAEDDVGLVVCRLVRDIRCADRHVDHFDDLPGVVDGHQELERSRRAPAWRDHRSPRGRSRTGGRRRGRPVSPTTRARRPFASGPRPVIKPPRPPPEPR